MKNSIILLALIICLILSFQQGSNASEDHATGVQEDLSAVKKLSEQALTAFNEGDLDAYMDTIAEDAIWMPPGRPPLVGKEEIRNWYNFDDIKFSFTLSLEEIEIHGDFAFTRSKRKGKWVNKTTGETTRAESNTINMYKRQPDGSWKTHRANWNFTKRETSTPET